MVSAHAANPALGRGIGPRVGALCAQLWHIAACTVQQHAQPQRTARLQVTLQGSLAAAAYIASSKGKSEKSLPGVSLTQLAAYFSIHFKDLFHYVVDMHSRLYPGTELKELVPVKSAFVASTVAYGKWKEFSHSLFPNGFAGTTGAPFTHPFTPLCEDPQLLIEL